MWLVFVTSQLLEKDSWVRNKTAMLLWLIEDQSVSPLLLGGRGRTSLPAGGPGVDSTIAEF